MLTRMFVHATLMITMEGDQELLETLIKNDIDKTNIALKCEQALIEPLLPQGE